MRFIKDNFEGLFFGGVVAICIAAKIREWKNRDGEDSDEG